MYSTTEERTYLDKKLTELTQSQNSCLSPRGVVKSVDEYCRVIGKKIGKFTFEQRQTFLRSLLEGIAIVDNQARIFGFIPVYTNDCDIMPTIPFSRGHNVTFRFELVEKIR